MLNEIRSRSLRFTPDETLAYLKQMHISDQSQNALDILQEQFEGWPAGLHLVVLTMRSEITQETVLSELPTDKSNVTGYLITEVINQQLPVIHSFLLKTSILDRFCAPLCEAILGEHDSAWSVRACLDWIERAELFIIPLDDHREWFRFHHLFQELLQQRLTNEMSPEQIANMHHQASIWFEEHNLLEEAMQHALAAGDPQLANHQMTIGMRDVINREDWPTLVRWLRLLPEEMIQRDPWLLMIRVWILELTWRLEQQAKVIAQVGELVNSDIGASMPEDDLKILRGQILMIRSQQLYFYNQTTQVIEMTREALALLPPMWTFVRGAAMLWLGLAMQSRGQFVEAERLLLDEYGSCSDKTEIYPLVNLQSLGYIYLWTGQLEKAIKIGQVLIQGATASNITIMKNWGDYFVGVAYYQRNELELAENYFNQIIKNRYVAHGSAYRDAVTGLALIQQRKGERAAAWQLVETISRSDIEETGAEDSRTGSVRAWLQLLQGDLADASRWVDTFSSLPPDQPIIWLEEPQVTRARILVARRSQGDLTLAMQVLDALDEIVDRTHNTPYKIEILAIRALAHEAQGERDSAEADLKNALNLAQLGGFVRVFVDLGKPMQELLQRLSGQGDSIETIRPILAAFSIDNKNPQPEINTVREDFPALPTPSMLVDPLTPRELEILDLLREPMSIKKIAYKLNISYETCRRHTANIYSKLVVNRRWDAVTRAEELKILSPR